MTTSTTTTSATTTTTASTNDTTASTTTGASETTTKVCKDEWWCRWRPQWTCNYLPMLKDLCPKKCGACEEESTTSTTTTTTTTATTPESCKDKFDFWCRMNFWRCRFSRGI